VTIILSNLNRFSNFFHRRFLDKFAISWLLKILLVYVATLPCEIIMSKNKRLTLNYNVV